MFPVPEDMFQITFWKTSAILFCISEMGNMLRIFITISVQNNFEILKDRSAKGCLKALGRKKKNLLTTTGNTTEKYIPRREKPQQSKITTKKLGSCFKGEDIYSSKIPQVCLSSYQDMDTEFIQSSLHVFGDYSVSYIACMQMWT